MRAWAVLLALMALGGRASAEGLQVHNDEQHHFSLSLPAGFTRHAASADTGNLGSYLAPRGLAMSLSRIAFPNLPAWWKNDRGAFFAQVLEGARRSVKGFQQRSQKAQRLDGVPALDLHFAREGKAGKELVWIRFLFHRRFAIVAIGSTPLRARRAEKKKAREFTHSLRPYVVAEP